jgi:long-subunit fatty acid transport protein
MGYLTPFHYDLITPLKASISASSIFNNVLISGEYELIDYSKSEYFTANFENENATIASIYQRTENIKIGAEITIKPFVLRAGYSKYGSAFLEKDFSRENFSYGMGINNGAYFIDVAYVLSQGANEHLLYSENYIAPISLINTNHSLLFTIGFRY